MRIADCMKANGLMIEDMARALRSTATRMFMKESSLGAKPMDWESISGRMERSIRDIGLMAKRMARALGQVIQFSS